MRILALLSLSLVAFACGDDDTVPDSGPSLDGGVDALVDDGGADAITDDAGGDAATDEGPPDFRIDGLTQGVSAHLDADGVLSLECETNEDCIAALGYFHARDRFVQMDFRRRATTGRLSGILNEFAAGLAGPVDARNRALYSTRDGEPAEDAMLAAATPETRAWLDAYARGVNAWIEDVQGGLNGAEFPREFADTLLFDYDASRIPPWEPSDSVATVLALINSLTNNSGFEIRMAERRAEFHERFGMEQGETMFRDLYDTRPDVDSPIIADFGAMASITPTSGMCAPSGNPTIPMGAADVALGPDLLAEEIFGAQLFGQPGRQGGFGSNNWVVGPSQSASGNALLANDPHLGMTNPATWYVAHLDAKTNGSGDLHAAGMTFAGLPFVVIGQNEDIAWGATTTVFDMVDVYVEEVSADGNSVTFNGDQVDIIKRMFSVERADGTSLDVELQFVPHHGPILPRESDEDPVLSLRWTGNDARTDINFLADLTRATDVASAQTALRQVTTIGQNWVVADTEGNIGWFPYNNLPQRPWATFYNPDGVAEAVPWMPLDGRGGYEWESYYDYDDLPQLLNPAAGYIATANNDMTGALADGDPTNETFGVFQINVAAGYRHQRIVDLLEASSAHDSASMAALIADTHSQIGEYLTPSILTAAAGLTLSDNAQKVITALTGWAYDCPTGLTGTDAEMSPLASGEELTESAGCAAFHVAIREINTATLSDEGIFGERGPNAAMVRLLRGETLLGGEIYWDNIETDITETKDQIIADALDVAGTALVEALGENEAEWAWGRLHFLNMRSDVDTASGGLVTAYNESNFANDGGLYTVDVANPGGDYSHTAGASMRLLCEAPSTGVTCTYQLPGGASAHPTQSSYLGLLDDYLSNTPRPLAMDIAAAAAAAAETLQLNPTDMP